MKELSIHTYEAWVLDWCEGKLSQSDEKRLRQFLKEHPDLPALPVDRELPLIEPVNVPCPNKQDLFRTEITLPELSELEFKCIAKLEGDLTEEEVEQFERELEDDEELAAAYERFALTKITPEIDHGYEQKEQLKKRVVALPAFIISAVSTAAALILVWMLIGPLNNRNEDLQFVQDSSRQVIYLNKIIHPAAYEKIAMAEPKAQIQQSIPLPIQSIDQVNERELVQIAPLSTVPIREVIQPDPLVSTAYSIAYRDLPYGNDSEYQSLGEFAGDVIRQRILGQDAELVERTRFSVWELADVGVEKVADFLNLSADINREYDEEGQLVEVAFDSRLLAFQAPIRNVR